MRTGLALLLLALAGCSGAHGSPQSEPSASLTSEAQWRSSAAQAMSAVRPEPARDQTCRQALRLTATGQQLRLRLSNAASSTPLRLEAVTAGMQQSGAAVRAGSLRSVTVAGQHDVDIGPGGHVVTDPVDLPSARGDRLLVGFAVDGVAALSSDQYGTASAWCSAPGTGDLTAAASAEGFVPEQHAGLVVDDVAVLGPGPRTVLAVGDSLTDAPLRAGGPASWTAALEQRRPAIPVVTAAIAGNRLLLEGGLGIPLAQRFDRDVLQRPGIGTVVLLAGTNDLARDATAAQLQHQLAALCRAASGRGLRVVLMTIPPADERTATQRQARHAVNAWIRTQAPADLVVDADAVLRDPDDPERLASEVDHGDGLHLSTTGHRRLGEAVAQALQQASTDQKVADHEESNR